jgi:CheY-like chemotaxis protein
VENVFIVYAEDDEDDRATFDIAINEITSNVIVKYCSDGEQFSKWAKQAIEIPDFIFLDINMPKCTGLDCLLSLRENPKFDLTIVIVISTSISPIDIELAFKRKANMYLVKPYTTTNLKIALRHIINANWNIPLNLEEFTLNTNLHLNK